MDDQSAAPEKRRAGRKPYPTWSFERALELPREISSRGVQGSIRRMTLFEELQRSAGSSSARELIANSAKYGLTTGNYNSEHLETTTAGATIATGDLTSDRAACKQAFELAIMSTDAFRSVYETLRNKKVPSEQVLYDLLATGGIHRNDCRSAGEVFLANVRTLGLVRDQAGGEYLAPIEQVLEEIPLQSDTAPDGPSYDAPLDDRDDQVAAIPQAPSIMPDGPSLHVDVQIHIDSSASPEQIEQIFESMSRHLYRRAE